MGNRLAILLLAAPGVFSCASPTAQNAGEIGENRVSRATIQEGVQRAAGTLTERIAQTMTEMYDRLPEADARARTRLMGQALVYVSSLLEIADEALPEVAMLDLVTFVRLCREVLENYWVPDVYGASGRELLAAFRKSETEVWREADQVLTPAQHRQLETLIDRWRAKNPEMTRVEGVRLGDFAVRAGRVEKEQADEVGGLFSNVKSAVASADQALLLGNRALFLVHRMPSLLRLQARLGTQQLLGDSLARLDSVGSAIDGARPLVGDLSQLTRETRTLAAQTEELLTTFRRLFPRDPTSTLGHKLSTLDRITQGGLQLVDHLNRARLDTLIIRLAVIAALVGLIWAVLFWGGYFIARRALRRVELHDEERRRRPPQAPPGSAAAALVLALLGGGLDAAWAGPPSSTVPDWAMDSGNYRSVLGYVVSVPTRGTGDFVGPVSAAGLNLESRRVYGGVFGVGASLRWLHFSGGTSRSYDAVPLFALGRAEFGGLQRLRPFVALGAGTMYGRRQDHTTGLDQFGWQLALAPEAGASFVVSRDGVTGIGVSARYDRGFRSGALPSSSYLSLQLALVYD